MVRSKSFALGLVAVLGACAGPAESYAGPFRPLVDSEAQQWARYLPLPGQQVDGGHAEWIEAMRVRRCAAVTASLHAVSAGDDMWLRARGHCAGGEDAVFLVVIDREAGAVRGAYATIRSGPSIVPDVVDWQLERSAKSIGLRQRSLRVFARQTLQEVASRDPSALEVRVWPRGSADARVTAWARLSTPAYEPSLPRELEPLGVTDRLWESPTANFATVYEQWRVDSRGSASEQLAHMLRAVDESLHNVVAWDERSDDDLARTQTSLVLSHEAYMHAGELVAAVHNASVAPNHRILPAQALTLMSAPPQPLGYNLPMPQARPGSLTAATAYAEVLLPGGCSAQVRAPWLFEAAVGGPITFIPVCERDMAPAAMLAVVDGAQSDSPRTWLLTRQWNGAWRNEVEKTDAPVAAALLQRAASSGTDAVSSDDDARRRLLLAMALIALRVAAEWFAQASRSPDFSLASNVADVTAGTSHPLPDGLGEPPESVSAVVLADGMNRAARMARLSRNLADQRLDCAGAFELVRLALILKHFPNVLEDFLFAYVEREDQAWPPVILCSDINGFHFSDTLRNYAAGQDLTVGFYYFPFSPVKTEAWIHARQTGGTLPVLSGPTPVLLPGSIKFATWSWSLLSNLRVASGLSIVASSALQTSDLRSARLEVVFRHGSPLDRVPDPNGSVGGFGS